MDGGPMSNVVSLDRSRQLGQFMTPFWAAERLVEKYFAKLSSSDLVLEPSAGTGAFLRAIPSHIPAVGVEIDSALAAEARRSSGRQVVEGDFRTISLSLHPTHIIGNPPYETQVIEQMLERCHQILPMDGQVGWILPAYFLQNPSRVMDYSSRWSLTADHLPRTLFPRLSHPLVFAMFRKSLNRTLVGFALYEEAAAVADLEARYRKMLGNTVGATWRTIVGEALASLGGEASLEMLYRVIEGKRPSNNRFWREKIRQQCQLYYQRTGEGRYALPKAA